MQSKKTPDYLGYYFFLTPITINIIPIIAKTTVKKYWRNGSGIAQRSNQGLRVTATINDKTRNIIPIMIFFKFCISIFFSTICEIPLSNINIFGEDIVGSM